MYITEGIPLGFAAVTMATQMRRQGLSAAAIGAFTAAIYLPWAFKWASRDPSSTWCLPTASAGAAAGSSRCSWAWRPRCSCCRAVGLGAGIGLLTTLIIVHNIFAATQDVAIDALGGRAR